MAFKKNRLIAVEERNTKIENMCMEELKRYLCMKNNQKPEKCLECAGLKSCKAGQRAVVLLNEIELDKISQTEDLKRNNGSNRTEIARKKFIQAINQPDMIKFLMETYGGSRNLARENLKHWARMFPDVAERYEFERKFGELSLKTITKINGSALGKRTDAIRKYEEAKAQDDPIAYCMSVYGWDRAKAVHNYGQWKRRYGEMMEDKKVDNEEISVEEFLRENGVERTEEVIQDEQENEKQDGLSKEMADFSGELNAKYRELEREKEKLKDRLSWIEKAQEALAMTLNIFNPDSAIGKAVNG